MWMLIEVHIHNTFWQFRDGKKAHEEILIVPFAEFYLFFMHLINAADLEGSNDKKLFYYSANFQFYYFKYFKHYKSSILK